MRGINQILSYHRGQEVSLTYYIVFIIAQIKTNSNFSLQCQPLLKSLRYFASTRTLGLTLKRSRSLNSSPNQNQSFNHVTIELRL